MTADVLVRDDLTLAEAAHCGQSRSGTGAPRRRCRVMTVIPVLIAIVSLVAALPAGAQAVNQTTPATAPPTPRGRAGVMRGPPVLIPIVPLVGALPAGAQAVNQTTPATATPTAGEVGTGVVTLPKLSTSTTTGTATT